MDCREGLGEGGVCVRKATKGSLEGICGPGVLEGLLVDKDVGRCLPAIAPGLMGQCWRMRQRHGGRRRRRLGAGLLLHACCLCEGTTVSVPWAPKVPVDQLKGVCVCVCVRERERERGGGGEGEREREREREIDR